MTLCRVVAALAAVVLLAPAAASAGVVRAETILPPGQSGFVAGSNSSPHLYDQVPLFTDFRFKAAPLGGASAVTTEAPRDGIAIRRDAFGVPAITAGSENDVWWAAGYAVAQDRLGEMELFKRRGSGRLAEILGKGSLDADIVARRDFYTDAELRRMFRRLPARFRARTTAYVAGVNAWIAKVRQDPKLLPSEFSLLGIQLRDWGVLDTLRVGVLLARTIPSDDGNELDNARALRALGAKKFSALLPLRVPGDITTIPAGAGTFNSQPGRTRAQERTAYKRTQRWLKTVRLPATAKAARIPTGNETPSGAIDVALGGVQGSFMWAIRRPSDRRTFFFNGPQLGYQSPNTFVEMDLTAPGTKLHLATAPGVPVNANGYNEHVAWGVTSGLSDEDDLFVVRLAGKERYRYKGKVRKMSCRTERFTYSEDGKKTSVRKRLCRTVHGPVQSRRGTYAFTRRYAIWNRELETLSGLAAIAESSNLQEVDRAMRKVTWNENILAADDQGNIGYWHPGLHPLRSHRWDERLPMPGDGRANWRGLLPRSKTPHVINPPGRNWLVNWNNTPSVGWTQGDSPAHERLNGPFHRIAMMQQTVEAAAADPSSFEKATIDVLRRTGTVATQRPAADQILREAAAGASGPAKTVLDTLVAWDGDYTRTAPDGTVEPGVATWTAFKAAAQVIALGAPRAATRGLLGTPGSRGFVESTLGETVALRTLDASGLRRAAAAAAEALTKEYRSAGPDAWRAKRATVSAQVQGLASPPAIPLQNRGTYEMAVELG